MSFGEELAVETKAGLISLFLLDSFAIILLFLTSPSLLLHHPMSSISETTFMLDIGFAFISTSSSISETAFLFDISFALKSSIFCSIFVLD